MLLVSATAESDPTVRGVAEPHRGVGVLPKFVAASDLLTIAGHALLPPARS